MQNYIVYQDIYGDRTDPAKTDFNYEAGDEIMVWLHEMYSTPHKCFYIKEINGEKTFYFKEAKRKWTYDY